MHGRTECTDMGRLFPGLDWLAGYGAEERPAGTGCEGDEGDSGEMHACMFHTVEGNTAPFKRAICLFGRLHGSIRL